MLYYFFVKKFLYSKIYYYYNNIKIIIKNKIILCDLIDNINELKKLNGLNKIYLEEIIKCIILNKNGYYTLDFNNINNDELISFLQLLDDYQIDNFIFFIQFLIINFIEFNNDEYNNILRNSLYFYSSENVIYNYLKKKIIFSNNYQLIENDKYFNIKYNDFYNKNLKIDKFYLNYIDKYKI
jgi:hypothetical protein